MLDALTLDQMRVFVTVAESGSFRAGAGRLSRVQSAVSHAIANLETELGVSVFDRSGHRPTLTPAGQALLANARDILMRVDAMRARAKGLGEGVELELSLIVDTLVPIASVGAALNAMRALYPSVAIRMSVEPLGGPISGLMERRYMLGIAAGDGFRDPRIVLEALSSVPLVAVVSTQHPLARHMKGQDLEGQDSEGQDSEGQDSEGQDSEGEALDVSDLADHIQVVLSDPSRLSEGRDFGVISPQTCRVTGQDTKHGLILAGLGWGRLPHWQVERDIAEGRLVRLATTSLGRNSEVAMETYLARRIDEPLGPAARAFTEALKRRA